MTTETDTLYKEITGKPFVKKTKDVATVDFIIVDNGSIVSFNPKTQAAKDWVSEKLSLESWHWLGNAFLIERRFACPIIDGIQNDGLTTTMDSRG